MTYKLTWLPGVLRAAGLEVVEYPGWQTAGHGDMGVVQGVLCHHTCGPVHGDLPDIDVLVHGRPDLGGPLCNLGLGRSGTYTMISAGAGWHAGRGQWHGIEDGNHHMIGIEAENTGETSGPRADTWPAVQMDAYKRGCAAICTYLHADPIMVAGHKEYALPHGRKDDPDFDMGAFRADVASIMAGHVIAPAAPTTRYGTANTDHLNVRSNASAKSTIVSILDKGNAVTITGQSYNGSTLWLNVGRGWVAAKYIDIK